MLYNIYYRGNWVLQLQRLEKAQVCRQPSAELGTLWWSEDISAWNLWLLPQVWRAGRGGILCQSLCSQSDLSGLNDVLLPWRAVSLSSAYHFKYYSLLECPHKPEIRFTSYPGRYLAWWSLHKIKSLHHSSPRLKSFLLDSLWPRFEIIIFFKTTLMTPVHFYSFCHPPLLRPQAAVSLAFCLYFSGQSLLYPLF